MPFVELTGTSGSFLNDNGQTVNYTVNGIGGTGAVWNPTNQWYIVGQDSPYSNQLEATFTQEVSGLEFTFRRGFQVGEIITIDVDGVQIQVDDLVASGDATISATTVDPLRDDGRLDGPNEFFTLTLNIPVNTLYVDHTQNLNGAGFDLFASTTVVCFTASSLIETSQGPVPAGDLSVGDLVLNDKGDYVPILWIGKRPVSAHALASNPKLRPVRITAGALGDGLPKRDLWVSRQHRMLLKGPLIAAHCGESEALVPAIRLTEWDGIFVDEACTEVTYVHFLLPNHDVVLAEGAWSESLYTGKFALKALPQAAQQEIRALFPELDNEDFVPEPARMLLNGKQARTLMTHLPQPVASPMNRAS